MADPKDFQEYLAITKENTKISGYGLDVTIEQPCFFCGAPDFMKYKIDEVEKVSSEEHHCKACGRSSKIIYNHDGGSTHFEPVQTGGPDQPDYFTHKMRRVEA